MVAVTVTFFLVSLASSIPRNNYNMWEKQRGMIFLSIIDLLTVSLPLTAKIFTLGNTCTCISSISHWMFGFQLHQTLSNERVWCSSAIQQNPLTKKKLNRSFDFWSQSNIELGYRTKWNWHKEHSNGTKTFQFQAIDDKCVNYWSSVKAVKAM